MRKQNKFLASCFVGLAALGFPSALPAQTYSEAMAAYQAFQSAGASGDEARTLDALYSCYKSLEAALRNAQPGNTEYSEMKNLMREIWPSLQRGAAYNSSHGNKGNAVLFAQAFIDVPLMPCFAGETFPTDDYFPTMAYFAASNTYNMKDYERAVKYFRVYLDTRDPKNRQSVFEHAAKAYMNLKNYDMAMNVLNEATDAFPDNFNMLSMAINNCIDRNDQPNLQRFVDKAIKLRPNDETLLNIQGKLYEDTQDFQKALNVYNKLKQSKPNNMTIMKHIAVNYYNLGVLNFNNAAMEQSSGNAKKFSRQAKEYFQAAASVLEDIVANEPASAKYLTALGTAYSCMGDNGKLEKTNTRLASVGGAPVSDKVVPVLMDYNSQGATGTFTASANTGTYTAGGSSYSATPAPASSPAASAAEAPQYSAYAKDYVETRLKKWLSKDPYETVSEYQARVNDQTRKAETDRLLKEAEKSYIDTYTKGIRFTDMTLKPYDADHGAFLVESRYGELIVPVPRENNEAKVFESGWSGM